MTADVVAQRLKRLEDGQTTIVADLTHIKVTLGRLTLIAGAALAGAGSVFGIIVTVVLQRLIGG